MLPALARAGAPQLELSFGAPRNGAELLARLRVHGLTRIETLTLTHNRSVMVSFKGTQLRVHEGFLSAPDHVLAAIVRFIQGRTRLERKAAQRVIVTHPISVVPRAPRRERTHPDDESLSAKLAEWHARYNTSHFDGALKAIPVRISRRMKSRLGHYSPVSSTGEPASISISRRHLRRHGWAEALETLLHEMVHQWQDETGVAIDHGRTFRAMARRVGVTPSARRRIEPGKPVR